jgi:hypothetical protein
VRLTQQEEQPGKPQPGPQAITVSSLRALTPNIEIYHSLLIPGVEKCESLKSECDGEISFRCFFALNLALKARNRTTSLVLAAKFSLGKMAPQ